MALSRVGGLWETASPAYFPSLDLSRAKFQGQHPHSVARPFTACYTSTMGLDQTVARYRVKAKLRGVSLTELSRRTGLTQGGVSLILNGHRNATVGSLRKLAAALDVTLDELDTYLRSVTSHPPESPHPAAA